MTDDSAMVDRRGFLALLGALAALPPASLAAISFEPLLTITDVVQPSIFESHVADMVAKKWAARVQAEFCIEARRYWGNGGNDDTEYLASGDGEPHDCEG